MHIQLTFCFILIGKARMLASSALRGCLACAHINPLQQNWLRLCSLLVCLIHGTCTGQPAAEQRHRLHVNYGLVF